ncbi:MAG TPA: hypothetical protein VGF92_10570 [Stellaceae bacterium]|jgi:hypothetical protein
MSSGWFRFLLVAAVGLGLSGCVAYPGPYGYGYYPAYYGPPVAGAVFIGGGGWHRGWR